MNDKDKGNRYATLKDSVTAIRQRSRLRDRNPNGDANRTIKRAENRKRALAERASVSPTQGDDDNFPPLLSVDPPSWVARDGRRAADFKKAHDAVIRTQLAKSVDALALERLCVAYVELEEVRRHVAEEGRTIMTEKGDIKLHPLMSELNRLETRFVGLLSKFKLVPASRKQRVVQKFVEIPPKPSAEEEAWDGLLN